MSDLVQIALILIALLLSFVAGYGSARRSNSIRMLDKWPNASVQFDSDMSIAEALRFIDLTRAALERGELLKAKSFKDEGATDER